MGAPGPPGLLRALRRRPALQALVGVLLGLLLGRFLVPRPPAIHTVLVPAPRPQRLRPASHGVVYTLGLQSPIIEVYKERYNGRAPYLEELLTSVATLRAKSPATPVALVTDHRDNVNASVAALFDQVVIREGQVHVSWGDVIPAVLATPWQRTLFLDLDVKICTDLEHMFGWLDHYDLAVVAEPYLFSHAKGALLHSKPQAITWNSLNNWNTGMILYDNNPRVRAFFQAWNAAYNYPGGRGGGDQETFAQWLELSSVRVKALPAEYNLRIHTNTLPHFLVGPVHLLHSRYETCASVNNVTTPRLYDHLKGETVYTWAPVTQPGGTTTLTSHCVADTVTVTSPA